MSWFDCFWNCWSEINSDDFLRGFVAKQTVDEQEKKEISDSIGLMNDLDY